MFYSPSQLLKRKGQVLHPIVPLFGASKPNQDAFARDLSDVPGAERYIGCGGVRTAGGEGSVDFWNPYMM